MISAPLLALFVPAFPFPMGQVIASAPGSQYFIWNLTLGASPRAGQKLALFPLSQISMPHNLGSAKCDHFAMRERKGISKKPSVCILWLLASMRSATTTSPLEHNTRQQGSRGHASHCAPPNGLGTLHGNSDSASCANCEWGRFGRASLAPQRFFITACGRSL